MAARKRKRLVPRRQPNGQPSYREPRDDVMGIVKAQRLRIVQEAHVMDQRVESPLGIYLIKGWIDEAQFYAGREYARIVAAAKRDDDSPPEDPQNRVLANLLPSDSRGVPVERLYSPEELRAKREERRRRYARVFGLLKQEGYFVMDAVNTVALRERGVAPERMDKLRQGLGKLAMHFRLSRGVDMRPQISAASQRNSLVRTISPKLSV
jgi:hypothetical protein